MTVRLKPLRKDRGWTLEVLAERTGLTKSYLSKVERGLSVPSIAVAMKLAGALGVPADTENMAMGERPIKLAEGTPIAALLA